MLIPPLLCPSAAHSSQWYAWGPTHMQCRLCSTCWVYWKKYGGLKMPTRLGMLARRFEHSMCICTCSVKSNSECLCTYAVKSNPECHLCTFSVKKYHLCTCAVKANTIYALLTCCQSKYHLCTCCQSKL